MKIDAFLSPGDVLIGLKANSKKQVLNDMVRHATSRVVGLDERATLDLIMERERLGCTGIGDGIAIPHSRCGLPTDQTAPVALLAVLENPIDFEANDDKPVDIVFMLLAPDTGGGEHLTALALASRVLRADDNAAKLRLCSSSAEAWELLNGKSMDDAAA